MYITIIIHLARENPVATPCLAMSDPRTFVTLLGCRGDYRFSGLFIHPNTLKQRYSTSQKFGHTFSFKGFFFSLSDGHSPLVIRVTFVWSARSHLDAAHTHVRDEPSWGWLLSHHAHSLPAHTHSGSAKYFSPTGLQKQLISDI